MSSKEKNKNDILKIDISGSMKAFIPQRQLTYLKGLIYVKFTAGSLLGQVQPQYIPIVVALSVLQGDDCRDKPESTLKNDTCISFAEWYLYFLCRMILVFPLQNDTCISFAEWYLYFLCRMILVFPLQNDTCISFAEWYLYFLCRMILVFPLQNDTCISFAEWYLYFLCRMILVFPLQL